MTIFLQRKGIPAFPLIWPEATGIRLIDSLVSTGGRSITQLQRSLLLAPVRGQRHLRAPVTSLCPAFHNREGKCQGTFPVYLDIAGPRPSFSILLPTVTELL